MCILEPVNTAYADFNLITDFVNELKVVFKDGPQPLGNLYSYAEINYSVFMIELQNGHLIFVAKDVLKDYKSYSDITKWVTIFYK